MSEETIQKTKLQNTQAKVDKITDIMQNNIQNLMLRDENLNDVNQRADEVKNKSEVFLKTAKKSRRETSNMYRFLMWFPRRILRLPL